MVLNQTNFSQEQKPGFPFTSTPQETGQPSFTPETPQTPEQLQYPESSAEQMPQQMQEMPAQPTHPEMTMPLPAEPPQKIEIEKTPQDQLLLDIEAIMSQDLEEAYKTLTPVEQQEFKLKGEETAMEIRELLKKSRVKMKKVYALIIDWLSDLPGINKFFIEQEAKIKADKIVSLKKTDSM